MLQERSDLIRACLSALERKGLSHDSRYKDRLKREIKEIDAQGEHEYFLDLHNKLVRFPENENNLLVDFLLDLAPDVNIDEDPAWVQGEFPDIDIDYIKPVRDYLKREWAADTFGQDKICEIGTYGTSGIKSAILDMASVHGVSKSEIQSITVRMEDKDADGNPIDWDRIFEIAEEEVEKQEAAKKEGKAPEAESVYLKFAQWCDENPEVAKAAELLIDRNRTGGVHAGGLIISDRAIDGFVPLEVRSVNKANPHGVICSAWTEGLNAQDLAPVGLIKFDLLVINNLMQIALACDLVKQRHGLDTICAVEGGWDWSDTGYLNDPEALEMANRGDLKCIFQFDSEGIRKLVKRGGVTCFDDLAAYSALYRPGPLGEGMDARYCKRKKWSLNRHDPDGEPWSIHPLMEPILGKTYGVMVFQEQVMEILRVVGNIPDMHTEKVRKAISKKKVKQFIKYKGMFIKNGMRNLGVNEDFMIGLWDQIESFAEYGFNKSHAYAYTYISARLLWLKTHYPLEFYTAILMCETDDDKFREYKLDAKYHGVPIRPVDINKSKVNFHIEDESIYFGFKNIKKIGAAVAERIVEHQPYESFRDFLDRFGTDATALKALCAIGVFDSLEPDYDHVHLRKFHEFYKDHLKKIADREKRFEASLTRKDMELKELLLSEVLEEDPDFESLCSYSEEAQLLWEQKFEGIEREVEYKSKGEIKTKMVPFVTLLKKLAAKRETSIRGNQEKKRMDKSSPVNLDQVNVKSVTLEDKEELLLMDSQELNGQTTYPLAESEYYGFQWVSVLETCTNYRGETIDKFLDQTENNPEYKGQAGPIEVLIRSVRKRTSKKGTEFYSVDIEDANARQMIINVWMDDYTRWREEFRKGNLLRIRVRPPSGGFNTLTFDSVPKHKRKTLPPKEDDVRIQKLKLPEKPKETDLDQFKFDENAVDVL